jgi:hypothetical protein
LIAFNVSSILVTFQGANYSASLVSTDKRVLDVIPGGIEVGVAQTQAVLIDMSPKVLQLGSAPNIAFAFLPSATAFVIPTNDIPVQAHVLGGRSNLELNPWWKKVAVSAHFEITHLTLLPNFLEMNVTNTGNTSVIFKLVTVTSTLNSTYGPSIPPFQTSSVFAVTPNGTLTALAGSNKSAILEDLSSDGYVLSPHATVTFSFSGTIQIGLIQFNNQSLASTAISVNQPYTVRLFGDDNVAFTDITG